MKVDILLAVYNGERFLGEQIESIINQTYVNWNLIIRDDNSTDLSLEIIKKYSEKDKRIILIQDKIGNVGVTRNFEILMMESKNPLIMFSDQDDVWIDRKIELMVDKIMRIKKCEVPLIVHSDAYVTDENLNPKKKFIGKIGEKKGLNKMIFHGIVQGSSMIFNRELLKLVLPFPRKINMHDYYLSLVCEKFGYREYINEPLMYYRQHNGNVLGTDLKKEGLVKKIFMSDVILSNSKHKENVIIFFEKYKNTLTLKEYIYYRDYIEIMDSKLSKGVKIYKLIKNRYFSFFFNMRVFLSIIMNKVKNE